MRKHSGDGAAVLSDDIENNLSNVNISRQEVIPRAQLVSLDDLGGTLPNSSKELEGVEESSTSSLDHNDSPGSSGNDKHTSVLKREKNSEKLIILRGIFFTCYLLLSVTLSFLLYWIISRNEMKNFEMEFITHATGFISSLERNLIWNKLSVIHALGTTVHSVSLIERMNGDANWPTYIIPNFEEIVSNSAPSSPSETKNSFLPVLFSPLVTDESRSKWELFSLYYNHEAKDSSLSGGSTAKSIYRFEQAEERNSNNETDSSGNNKSYSEAISDYGPGPYFPVSQLAPYLKEMKNYNLLSNSEIRNDILTMMETGYPVIGRITPTIFNENETLSSIYYNLIFAGMDKNLTSQQPLSHIFYPVYDSVPRGGGEGENGKALVGLLTTIVFWNEFVASSIPLDYSISSSGAPITLVMKNVCANDDSHSLTYEVQGNASSFKGYGDLHDAYLSSYSQNAYFDIQEYFAVTQGGTSNGDTSSSTGNHQHCLYSVHVYPSQQYRDDHVTHWPKTIATISAVLLIFLFVVVLIYDHIMKEFVHSFAVEARQSQAIVASFFPENVHSRIFERPETNKKEPKRRKNSGNRVVTSDSSFVESKEMSYSKRNSIHSTKTGRISFIGDVKTHSEERRRDSIDEAMEWEPIADFFPHCTVLFADIAGFTSYSSSRTPEQVFTLLQVLFAMLDKQATKYNIFKVETIGDCYMCVTGLPDPQPDHALRMVKFARSIVKKMVPLVKKLERRLGPGTGDLRLRVGLHSGPVTGGVLRGEKSRFQLFGDTVNTASRVESTGERNRIQISQATANLLNQAGKSHWFKARSEFVHAKGKGEMQTYWIIMRSIEKGTFDDAGSICDQSSLQSSSRSLNVSARGSDNNIISIWGNNGDDNVESSSPKMPRSQKNKRLVLWMVEILKPRLKQMVAQRKLAGQKRASITPSTASTSSASSSNKEEMMILKAPKDVKFHGESLLDEVVETFTPAEEVNIELENVEETDLSPEVLWQLHTFVTKIASMYRDNPFHNFEHACHVTQSVDKLLKHVQDDHKHDCSFVISSDPLAKFAIIFSALIHDVDHRGVGNMQLSNEYPEMGEKYKKRSIAEQNSIDLSWELLMDPEFEDLQKCIFTSIFELKRFRELVVNSVLATDIFDKEGKSFREQRWGRAFDEETEGHAEMLPSEELSSNLKTTIVIEHIIQASDVVHTMQHWKLYTKWNERLFQEMYAAFDCGRLAGDPSANWYKGELWFFDNYVIPLAKKLDQCSVFGVAYDECLNNAVENREEWRRKGEQVVQEMKDRYHKRKSMEIGGFTDEEIGTFTPEDLKYIMQKLIEKGRNNGSKSIVDSQKGQNDAAQAWLDALEIWERAPSALEMRDRTIIFPIFSGIIVWIKGGKIKQDEDKNFEQNLANIFVRESREHGDPVHYSRALAMKCEVMCRLGKYDIAFKAFEELKSVYDPVQHSLAVAEVYGGDRSMHAFSQSALWHMALGDTKAAMETCNYVIDDLLPLMDPTNTLGKHELLLPVFHTLKVIGGYNKKMRDLMNDKIIEEFNKFHGPDAFTPGKPVHKPMLMLFDICLDPDGIPNFLEEVDWLIDGTNGEIPDFVDSIWVKLCWSMHSLCAELCLRFANRLGQYENCGDFLEKRKKLIAKGLRNAKRGDVKMKGSDGAVILPIPHRIHEPVFRELKEAAASLGIEDEEDEVCVGSPPSLDVNLPLSYLKPPSPETI